MQAVDFFVGQIEFLEARLALGGIHARTKCADIERRRLQCLHQRHVVKLGVVGHRDHRAVRVKIQFDHHVIGHAGDQFDVGHVPVGAVFLARVADDHAVVQRLRHFGQVARQLPGADDQQAPQRTVNHLQGDTVEKGLVGARGRRDAHRAGFEVDGAHRQFVTLGACQDVFDPGRFRDRFLHQLERAATGQAEARGILGGHAVGHHFRLRL